MQLNYKKFGEGFPLVILHGLLGSLDNWQTIAKHLSAVESATRNPQLVTYILDQRNHGRSPRTDEFNYDLLSNDLLEFFEQEKIEKAHIIGHSMGGKVAMKFALEHADKVSKLIVVDVAPAQYEDRHSDVFNALFAANVQHANSREEVEKVLREKLSNDETTVQFLLKSLTRAEVGQTGFQWRFNLDSLRKNYSEISAAITSSKQFAGETLFIKGEKSSYINAENFDSIEKVFPKNKLVEIKGAGHWVHAEKPQEFLKEVISFLES